jgi:hypothetical protein
MCNFHREIKAIQIDDLFLFSVLKSLTFQNYLVLREKRLNFSWEEMWEKTLKKRREPINAYKKAYIMPEYVTKRFLLKKWKFMTSFNEKRGGNVENR